MIIGGSSGKHHQATGKSVAVPIGLSSGKAGIVQPNAQAAMMPAIPVPAVFNRQLLALPQFRGTMVNLAINLAGMAWRPDLAERVQSGLRQILDRYPRAQALRVARLLLELEKQGLNGDSGLLVKLLDHDGFATLGLASRLDASGDFAPSGQSGGGGSGRQNQGQREPEGEEPVVHSDSPGAAPASLFVGPGPPPGTWIWLSLPAGAGILGGGMRYRQNADTQDIAVDVLGNDGCWQFYWSEPNRSVLHYLPPASIPPGRSAAELENLTKLLGASLGGLGFAVCRAINDTDWIDGFNFFESNSILGHVDVVV